MMKLTMFNNTVATRAFICANFPTILMVLFSNEPTVSTVSSQKYVYGLDSSNACTFINLLDVKQESFKFGYQPLTQGLKEKIEQTLDMSIPWVDPTELVVGEIVGITALDRYSLVSVDVNDQIKSIVCGAQNLSINQKTIVALHNSVLVDGTLILEGEVGQTKSSGMLCSLSELTGKPAKKGIVTVHESIHIGTRVNVENLEEILC